MQAKDIDAIDLITYIKLKENILGRWVLNWDFDGKWLDMPFKVIQAKMRNLIKKGLLDGCTCGCRGDFTVTIKGKDLLIKELDKWMNLKDTN